MAMTADVTAAADSVRSVRRRSPVFGLSWRILGLVIAAVMTAEILIFLPSIARFRMVYLEQLIESGTLAALALDATPDNMVTEGVKRALLNNARVDAVVLVEPNKPKRALMNIEPRPTMPSYNLKEEGVFPLIWDALTAMVHDGARYIRVGGESMRLPRAMVCIMLDDLPMRIAMHAYGTRILVLSAIIALRCARNRGWPKWARRPTRSTTTCATCCRRRGCCPTGWRAATMSAPARSRRPSSIPSTARRGWRATPSNMSATGRRRGSPTSIWPIWSTK